MDDIQMRWVTHEFDNERYLQFRFKKDGQWTDWVEVQYEDDSDDE